MAAEDTELNWSEIAKKVAPFAPAIAGALAGPAGPIVAMAGNMIARKLGVAATPHAVAQALASMPDAEEKITEADLELARIYTADMQDAREEHKGHWMPPLLTVMLALMMAALGYMLFSHEIPATNRDMANIAFGSLLAAFGTAVSYWLGSSRGSAEKQQTIDRSLR